MALSKIIYFEPEVWAYGYSKSGHSFNTKVSSSDMAWLLAVFFLITSTTQVPNDRLFFLFLRRLPMRILNEVFNFWFNIFFAWFTLESRQRCNRRKNAVRRLRC